MDYDIKIVGLDLDGTTLDRNGKFSKRTRETFAEAMEKGVHIVVATGRTWNSLPDEIFHIKGLEYVVTSNGARVFRLADKTLIYENCLSPKAVEDLVKIFRAEQLNVEAFVEGKAFISRREFEDIRDYVTTTRDRGYVLSTRNPVENIYDFLLEHKDNIENISVNYPNNDFKALMEEKLSTVNNITLTSSFPLNNEIGDGNTSKANGLKHLMKILGLKRENLMACGDSPNDMAMIQYAEVGVAMANAERVVKEAADYVTLSNADDGVAAAIDKFVLHKEI